LFLNLAFIVSGEVTRLYFYADTDTLYRYYLPVVNLLWLLSGALFTLYLQSTMDRLENIYRATLRSIALHVLLFSLYLFSVHGQGIDASTFLLGFYSLFAFSMLISRLVGTYIQVLLEKHFHIRKTVAIMGKNEGGRSLAH